MGSSECSSLQLKLSLRGAAASSSRAGRARTLRRDLSSVCRCVSRSSEVSFWPHSRSYLSDDGRRGRGAHAGRRDGPRGVARRSSVGRRRVAVDCHGLDLVVALKDERHNIVEALEREAEDLLGDGRLVLVERRHPSRAVPLAALLLVRHLREVPARDVLPALRGGAREQARRVRDVAAGVVLVEALRHPANQIIVLVSCARGGGVRPSRRATPAGRCGALETRLSMTIRPWTPPASICT